MSGQSETDRLLDELLGNDDVTQTEEWRQRADDESPPGQPGSRTRRRAVVVLLGVVAIAAIFAAGWIAADLGTGDGEETAITVGRARTADPEAVAAAEEAGERSGGPTVLSTTTSITRTTLATTGPPEDFPDTLAGLLIADITERRLPHAVIDGGIVYLRGRVPTAERVEEAVARTAAIVGPGGVVDEMEVDPNVPIYDAVPVYVEDVVLFEFASTTIEPEFFPILDLAVLAMFQSSTVTVTIVAYADSIGSEEANLAISQRRAESVVDYWVERGIERDRIIIDARGETLASGSQDIDEAAFDRRVEFFFDGFLR